MASSTSIDGDTFGSLIFVREKDGKRVPFDLRPGQVTFGGDNADIRLKIADERLRDMHCFIYIDENGVATLVNKAGDDTVKVNDGPVKKMHVLDHQDAIDVLGKIFLYENENLRCDEVQTGNAVPGISSRHTIHVLAQKKSPTKSPTLNPRQVYAPVVEDVSPATPPNSKGDDAIKTPLNTPGLFEDLRTSVLQSRTRRSGKKEESEQNINNKRGRNSSIASQSSVKKRRTITYSVEDASEVEMVEESVESFNSTEDWPEISQDQTDHEHRLSDLTIASFANQPFSTVLSEPRVRQMKSVRLSRHNKTIAVDNLDGPEPIVKCSFLLENGLREDLLDKSPKPSTSNFVKSTTSASSHFIRNKSLLIGSPASAKLKRLQQSPKTVKGSPKLNVSENLSKFFGLKQLMRRRTSPSDIFGIKNFMSAQNKSPKNDTILDSMDQTIVTDSSRSSRTLKLTENAKAIKSPRLSTNFTRTPLDAMKRSMSTPRSMKKLEYEILDLSAVKTPSSELQTRASKTSVTENAQNYSTRTNKVLASSIPNETVHADKTKRLSRASSRFDSSEYELLDLSKTVRVDQSRKGLLNTSGKRTLKNVFLNGNGPKNSILSPRGINSLLVKNAVETLKTYASLPDLNAAATRSTANTSKRSLSTSKHRNSAETFDVEKDKSVIDQYDDDLQEVSKTRKSSSTSQELDSPDIEIKRRSWSLRSSKSNTRAGGDDLEINRSTRRSSAYQYPADYISIDLSGISGSLISLKTSSSDQSPDVIKICDLVDNLLEVPSDFRYDEGTVEADVTESLSRKQSASRKSLKNSESPKNDLSNIRGVKNLLKTPKVPKSPKNDLTDIRGVKKLLRTPKVRKSPKNDLSNIVPLKMLMSTPKPLKEHINDLSNVSGVKDLFIEKQEELFDSVFNKKPVQKTRGKKRKVAEPAKVEVESISNNIEDKAIKTRRNKKGEVEVTVEKDTSKDVQEVAAKPAGRLRRNKKTELEETVEKDSDKNVHDKAVKPAGRLRRNKKTDIEKTVEKDTSKDIECNAVKPAGRRNNKTVEESVEEDSETDIQNKVVKTAGRPRRNLKTKIEETVTSSASKTNVDESVKPISRSKRNEKAENGESIKNINKRTESETASRSGDNKEKEIEKNDSEDKPMRITRGKKKVVNPSLNDETTSRRPKKDQTVESVKVTKGRQKKATLNEEDVENKKVNEIEEERPKRSRRAKGDDGEEEYFCLF